MSYQFEITDEQLEKVKEWDKCEDKSLHGAIGERLVYKFVSTGLGDFVSVRCLACGEELNLTDYDRI